MEKKYATLDELKDRLYDLMISISEHKDNWRLKAEDKRRLDNAASELGIVLDHLEDYQ